MTSKKPLALATLALLAAILPLGANLVPAAAQEPADLATLANFMGFAPGVKINLADRNAALDLLNASIAAQSDGSSGLPTLPGGGPLVVCFAPPPVLQGKAPPPATCGGGTGGGQSTPSTCECSGGESCGACTVKGACDGLFQTAACSCQPTAQECTTCGWCSCALGCTDHHTIWSCTYACSGVGPKGSNTTQDALIQTADDNQHGVPTGGAVAAALDAYLAHVPAANRTEHAQLLFRVTLGLAVRDIVGTRLAHGTAQPVADAWARVVLDYLAWAHARDTHVAPVEVTQ